MATLQGYRSGTVSRKEVLTVCKVTDQIRKNVLAECEHGKKDPCGRRLPIPLVAPAV